MHNNSEKTPDEFTNSVVPFKAILDMANAAPKIINQWPVDFDTTTRLRRHTKHGPTCHRRRNDYQFSEFRDSIVDGSWKMEMTEQVLIEVIFKPRERV
jgi:hypothetical protein